MVHLRFNFDFFSRKLRCNRNIIHVNLFIAFALRCVVIFIKDAFVSPEGVYSTKTETATINTSGSVSYTYMHLYCTKMW